MIGRSPERHAATWAQIERLTALLTASLPGRVTGCYVHGSLALGCFNPSRSDVDLLVVLQDRLVVAERRRIIEALLALSLRPHPIEVSFVTEAQLVPWRYPTPFELHYSEAWRDRYAAALRRGSNEPFEDAPRHDPDLAAHVTVTRARGVSVIGPEPVLLLPDVPASDYRASLAADIEDSLCAAKADPVYLILNACRTFAYLSDGRVQSKHEGGRWALRNLPAALRGVVEAALDAYDAETGAAGAAVAADEVVVFARFVRRELLPRLRSGPPA